MRASFQVIDRVGDHLAEDEELAFEHVLVDRARAPPDEDLTCATGSVGLTLSPSPEGSTGTSRQPRKTWPSVRHDLLDDLLDDPAAFGVARQEQGADRILHRARRQREARLARSPRAGTGRGSGSACRSRRRPSGPRPRRRDDRGSGESSSPASTRCRATSGSSYGPRSRPRRRRSRWRDHTGPCASGKAGSKGIAERDGSVIVSDSGYHRLGGARRGHAFRLSGFRRMRPTLCLVCAREPVHRLAPDRLLRSHIRKVTPARDRGRATLSRPDPMAGTAHYRKKSWDFREAPLSGRALNDPSDRGHDPLRIRPRDGPDPPSNRRRPRGAAANGQ